MGYCHEHPCALRSSLSALILLSDVLLLITGLCCAALLARYGKRVTVCEAHYLAGGAAQSFDIKGYQFDAGPSFFAGLSGR